MLLKQLSIFLENRPGMLAEVTNILKEKNINIRALSMADTTNFGILRIIVSQPDEVKKILKEKNITVKTTDVFAVKVSDAPGGLNTIISKLSEEEINVEYMYAFVNKSNEDAIIIFKVHNIQKAIQVLIKNNVKIFKYEDIFHI